MIFAEPVAIVLSLGRRKTCDLPFELVGGESTAICTLQGEHVTVTFATAKADMGGQPSSVGQRLVSFGAERLLHAIERYNATLECPPGVLGFLECPLDVMEYLNHCHKICLQIRNQCLRNCFGPDTAVVDRQP
jgi:hypothetical protein